MSGIRTGTVTSADGTVIGFDRSGAGPAVILVQGALMNRSDPVMTGIAAQRRCQPGVDGSRGKGRGERHTGAVHRVLPGQPHYVAPEAVVPEMLEFLVTV
jgi:hypothetical protein